MVTLQADRLIDFVAQVFERAGSSKEEARRIGLYDYVKGLRGD